MTITTDIQTTAAERFLTDYASRAYLAPKYDYAGKLADDVSIPLIALILEMPEETVRTVLNDEAGKPPRRLVDRAGWTETAKSLLLLAAFECAVARTQQ